MRFSFTDISLYIPTSNRVGTSEYWRETSLQNFVSDLYVQKMNGYKPPNTTRITIQPAFHNVWKRTWKNGSIVATAPYFNQTLFAQLDKKGKSKYILDLIQNVTLSLSDEYGWDKSVFENAYSEVLKSNFQFKITYTPRRSKDRNKLAFLFIEKTETTTSLFVEIQLHNSTITKKLFEKNNDWWHDIAYRLVKHSKWLDNDKFGVLYKKRMLEIWYTLIEDEVVILINGEKISEADFPKYFQPGYIFKQQ